MHAIGLGSRRSSLWAIALLFLACVNSPGLDLCAQDAGVPTLPLASPEQGSPVLDFGAVKPDAWYFYDKEAGLRLMVPGMSFQEIQRLQDQDAGLVVPEQTYSFVSTEVQGTVDGDRAVVEVKYQLRVDPTTKGWTRIPLQLQGMFLMGALEVEGTSQFHLELPKRASGTKPSEVPLGYGLRVSVTKPTLLTVRGEFRIPVITQAGLESLTLQLPEAPTSIQLVIAQPDLSVGLIGRGDELVPSDEAAADQSPVAILGDGGEVGLRWQKSAEQAGPAQVLEAEGRWQVTWATQTERLRAALTLTVQNLRGPITPFEIVIPEPASLVPDAVLINQPKVQLSPATASGPGRWLVQPADGETQSSLDVELILEFPIERPGPARPLKLPDVEVVGALRQRGLITIEAEQPNRLRWNPGSSVRPLRPDAASVTNPKFRPYRFEYNRVPVDLEFWTEDRQEQVRLVPSVAINLDRQNANLTLTVGGTTNVVAGQPLLVYLGPWQASRIEGPAGPLSADEYRIDAGALVIEPEVLLVNDLGSGSSPLELRVRADLALEDEVLSAELPRLQLGNQESSGAAFIESSTVVVRTDGAHVFIPDLEQSVGLQREAGDNLSPDQVTFRAPDFAVPARLSGYLLEKSLTMRFDAGIEVAATDAAIELTESFRLQLGGGQLNTLALHLVGDQEAGAWQVSVDGVPAIIGLNEAAQPRLIPQSPLEPGLREIVFRRTLVRTGSKGTETLSMPFIALAEENLVSPAEIPLRVQAAEGLQVETGLSNEDFSVGNRLLSTLPRDGLLLRLTPQAKSEAALEIDRLWLQTVIGQRRVRHRAAMRLEQGAGRLRLPASMIPENAEVRLEVNGQSTPIARTADDYLEASLLNVATPASVVVSVWTEGEELEQPLREVSALLAPWGTEVNHVYWQLISPSNEHAVRLPEGAATAMRWLWSGWHFRREPIMTDRALADWVGVAVESPLPIGNRYLVEAMGGDRLKARTMDRAWLWMLVASVVLVGATALLYLPLFRHPLILVALSLVVMGAAFTAPDLAMLCGQLTIAASTFVWAMLAVRGALLRQPQRSALGPRPARRADGSTRRAAMANLAPTAAPDPVSTRPRDLSLQPLGDASR